MLRICENLIGSLIHLEFRGYYRGNHVLSVDSFISDAQVEVNLFNNPNLITDFGVKTRYKHIEISIAKAFKM